MDTRPRRHDLRRPHPPRGGIAVACRSHIAAQLLDNPRERAQSEHPPRVAPADSDRRFGLLTHATTHDPTIDPKHSDSSKKSLYGAKNACET